ncbi:AMP-binding protein [Streptomyces agglomeratus]|uniref:AMP-binding protein n=1 Tax=Streptomyces agglomeratus TaxID=285458 RepID=UPI00085475AE|nr:AMP-binding protein [Streptomyces agglomeratus]OEJ36252.1 peptide synthetase [Streptomyces agglomeratus]
MISGPSAQGELVHGLLDAAAREVPDAPAVRDATGAWTYRQLDHYSQAFARWLSIRGIGRGDRVVLQLPTNRKLAAMFYGASRCGVIFVPLNPAMKTFHLRQVIDNAEPKLLIGGTATAGQLADIAGPVHLQDELWAEVEELRARGARFEPEPVRPDDVATLIYTSGSTAAPKAVICPHAQVTFASRALTDALGYRADDVVFCRFPMSWDYGLYKVVMTCISRSEIVLADGESDLLLLRRMRETGATVVPVVPSFASMIINLARRAPADLPPVRMFTNTGAALPQATTDTLRKLFPGVRVVRQYGQTEAKRITVMPPAEDRERPGAVGLPLPGTRVLILDDEGRPVPAGQVGEIVAVGPHVMPGYWNSHEVTAKAFRQVEGTGEACLHTGDYGSLDVDGYLYFEGRRDDMFKRKGFRMSTLEIEGAAMDIPGVRAAGALAPTSNHDLTIFVESDLEPSVVLKELAQRLEPAKVPAICRVLAEFPLTQHGKNARQELALLLDGSGA